jgi:ATP-dependent RNA helicase HelY
VRAWSELEDLESEHRLETTVPLDLGLVESVHRWASGRSLDAVLRGGELSAGDFVRWCKQVIDVLDQLGQAAPDERLRTTARRAVDSLRRGVVAYSSV